MNILDQLAEIQWLLNIRKSNIQIDYEYDENQNLIRNYQSRYDESSTLTYEEIYEYEYDENHNRIVGVLTTNDYVNNTFEVYDYDFEQENWILRTN